MEKAILGAYSALTVADFLLFILALSVLAKCVNQQSFNGTFKMAVGLALWSGFQFLDRAWWTIWKSRYISREPSAWMYNHEVAFFAPIFMTGGILLVILSLTEDSPYRRFFGVCCGAIFCGFVGACLVK